MANRRYRRQEEIERLCLEQLRQRGPGWVTSRELAWELGQPCLLVARALIRLASAKTVDQQTTTWISSKSRTRECFAFRLVEVTAIFPAWMLPPARPVISGSGRIIRMKE